MMCICCDKKISLLHPEELDVTEEDLVFTKSKRLVGRRDQEIETNAGTYMWNNGLVHKISANYGSSHDGDEFIIAICDDCITKKKATGNIAYLDNYLGYLSKEYDEDYIRSRTAWRRYNNMSDFIEKESQ